MLDDSNLLDAAPSSSYEEEEEEVDDDIIITPHPTTTSNDDEHGDDDDYDDDEGEDADDGDDDAAPTSTVVKNDDLEKEDSNSNDSADPSTKMDSKDALFDGDGDDKKPNGEETVIPPRPERPKRGRSAYNYFFRAERAKILGMTEEELDEQQRNQKRKHRKTPGMMGFSQLASYVGDKWRALSEEEKIPYQRRCQADRERYKHDINEWRKKYGNSSKSNCDSDEDGEVKKKTKKKKTKHKPKLSSSKSNKSVNKKSSSSVNHTGRKANHHHNVEGFGLLTGNWVHDTDAFVAASMKGISGNHHHHRMSFLEDSSVATGGTFASSNVMTAASANTAFTGMSEASIRRRQNAEKLVRETRLYQGGMDHSATAAARLADAFEPTPFQEMMTLASARHAAATSLRLAGHQTSTQQNDVSSLGDLCQLANEVPEWKAIFSNLLIN